jgi:hypothetical protein
MLSSNRDRFRGMMGRDDEDQDQGGVSLCESIAVIGKATYQVTQCGEQSARDEYPRSDAISRESDPS